MKKLILTAAIVIGVVAGVVRVGRAQTQSPADHPDFSGKWVLASSQPPGTHAFGHDFSIAQDATSLVIDSTGLHITASRTGPSSETPFPIRTIYALDGIEHASQVIADPPMTPASAPTSGV